MAKNRVIGKDNQLPWHFSADLKFFKELTTGHTVIMGRKTHESIGRPLPNRENFILSKTKQESKDSLRFFNSIDEAIKEVKTEKAFIIGGSTIYDQTLDVIDGIYLTHIDQEFEGDAYYPKLPDNFREEGSRQLLQENPKIEVIFYQKTG